MYISAWTLKQPETRPRLFFFLSYSRCFREASRRVHYAFYLSVCVLKVNSHLMSIYKLLNDQFVKYTRRELNFMIKICQNTFLCIIIICCLINITFF